MSNRKLAIVTGASRGLGLCLIRTLAKTFPGDIYLTCRNPTVGEKLRKDFHDEGFKNVKNYQLDMNSEEQIDRFLNQIRPNYKGIDLLIHNAGIFYEGKQYEISEDIIKTNFLSVVYFAEKSMHLLNENARIIHISSTTGNWVLGECSPEYMKQLRALKSFSDFRNFGVEYLKQIKDNAWKEDFDKHLYRDYAVSKCFLTMLSNFIDEKYKNVTSVAICPGYMNTDMSLNDESGIDPMISAKAVLDLYEKPTSEVGGKFYRLNELIDPFHEPFSRKVYEESQRNKGK